MYAPSVVQVGCIDPLCQQPQEYLVFTHDGDCTLLGLLHLRDSLQTLTLKATMLHGQKNDISDRQDDR
jgi:hypothetical protein